MLDKSKNKLSKTNQDSELMRFGHTITLINKQQAILFGGAKGASSKYDICDDSYLFKIDEHIWVKLHPTGQIPCPRAAHAAASAENSRLIVFGGAIVGGGLAPDSLHLLDLYNGEDKCLWITLPTSGTSPGKRYGHSMSYLRPYLVVFGGNIGNKITNEICLINIDDGILEWKKLEPNGEYPCSRMYHASSVCRSGGANGMLIIFGGRSDNNNALNDTWGLRKHRNGTWDWVKAPYSTNYTPFKRFQHTTVFFNNLMIVLGGRTDEDLKSISIEVYDTETSEWFELTSFNKFRHSSWIVDNLLFTHGGFDYTSPMISKNDLVMIDMLKLLNTNNNLSKKLEKILDNNKKNNPNSNKTTPSISPTNSNSSNNSINNITANFNNIDFQLKLANKVPTNGNKKTINKKVSNSNNNPIIFKEGEISILSNKTDDKVIIKKILFDDKGKIKINNEIQEEPLYDKFLKILLNPIEWIKKNDTQMTHFPFHVDDIVQLTRECTDIVASQPIVLRVSTPCKVFGDIHGQYIDLMTFFYKWGEPKEGANGDINAIDYLFLGDYVDRGNMSLETICLLMALKVKFPDRIHLLRGNHEDKMININFGFYEECENRLGENSSNDDSVFSAINEFFDYLPLAAIVEDQILCLHGGIGANVNRISDVEVIQRPLEVVHEATNKNQQVVMDILWSDPTDNDDELGIQPNLQRDSNNYGNIVKYGPDVVRKFLQNNNLSFIIRAHECVLDGFERFASGAVITLFSATDYCRRHNNAGAMLIIKNNFEMVPHLIYPPDGGNKHWIDDEDSYKKRPPTPPRVRYNKNY